MANATVCLHYKEGDVSASFKLVLSPALQAKHATGKLLACSGQRAGLGKERQESFKKLMEGEAQRGDWKKEKRWARRGQIPRPGCRWVTCVDDVPCLVAEILGKEPVEDPSGAAPAGLRGGERVVARRYGVSKEHVLRWGEHASEDAKQMLAMAPRWLEVEYDDGDDVVCGWAPAVAFFDAEEPPELAELGDASPSDDDDDDGVLPRPPGIAPSSGAASSRPTSGDRRARDRPSPGLLRAEPDDADGLFCRAGALARLRFPKLALDQLDLVKATHGASLTERQARTLDAARDHAAEKIAALAKPKRKTKKRW
ncbi:hypothetical protein JL722_12065 [Aureococcus anophagefferens]|nr:hypothetical protein JL722_12065 [Aureococcus anophagefferens]